MPYTFTISIGQCSTHQLNLPKIPKEKKMFFFPIVKTNYLVTTKDNKKTLFTLSQYFKVNLLSRYFSQRN